MAGRSLLMLPVMLFAFLPVADARHFSGFGQEVDRYIRDTAAQYNISEPMLRGLVKMEAGWTGQISPTGATGVGQFTTRTWNWLARTKHGQSIGMQLITPANRGTAADPRHNKYINTLATGLYTRWHIERFRERGIRPTDANLYMAHNIGLEGFHRALLGKSTANDIKNMRRNGMKRWMTVQDFIHYQKARYTRNQYAANSPNLLTFTRKLADKAERFIWVNPNNVKTASLKTNKPSNSSVIPEIKPLTIQTIEKDITKLKPVAIETFTIKTVDAVEKGQKPVVKPVTVAIAKPQQHAKAQAMIWETEQQMIWVVPQ